MAIDVNKIEKLQGQVKTDINKVIDGYKKTTPADAEYFNNTLKQLVDNDVTLGEIKADKTYVDTINNSINGLKTNNIFNVPKDFPTINDAINHINGLPILGKQGVTIQVADGTYEYSSQIDIITNHRLSIVGNTTDPSKCKILFKSCNGFVVDQTNGIFIKGFTIESDRWTSTGVWKNSGNSGIYVTNHSSVTLGSIDINKFFHGISAYKNSYILANSYILPINFKIPLISRVTITEAGDSGIIAVSNSTILAEGIYIKNTKNGNACGYGIYAFDNSCIQAPNSTVEYNHTGVYASRKSYIQCEYSITQNNTQSGIYADVDSTIVANGNTSSNNGNFGYCVTQFSKIYAFNAKAENNTLGNYSIAKNTIGSLNSAIIG